VFHKGHDRFENLVFRADKFVIEDQFEHGFQFIDVEVPFVIFVKIIVDFAQVQMFSFDFRRVLIDLLFTVVFNDCC
jgi:hypothetical protein